ncbi:MAG: hypothetical protein PHC84_03230 [Clostridia bacterium]|nr:hypothetical protein [Clostridia bacterium]
MANEKGKSRVALLGKLTFAPEARSQEAPRPVIQGRFKYFMAVFKKYNNQLMVANLLFLIFCLPLLAVLIIPTVLGGMENISYIIAKTTDLPYFMTDIGIGFSSGQGILEGRLAILKIYQFFLLGIAAAIPFMSPGLAGLFHVSVKLIWQDPFVTKKDTYGNNVPRIGVEFFKGLKKYWLPMLIISTVFAALFAGVSSSFIYFIESYWLGAAGAGQWILVIAAAVIGLLSLMLLIYMLPMTPMYSLPLIIRLKNSVILMVSMFIPTLFVTLVAALPFILVAVTSGIIKIVITAVLLVFGSGFLSLLLSNFAQYHADKIITPIYEAQHSKSGKSKKKTQNNGARK